MEFCHHCSHHHSLYISSSKPRYNLHVPPTKPWTPLDSLLPGFTLSPLKLLRRLYRVIWTWSRVKTANTYATKMKRAQKWGGLGGQYHWQEWAGHIHPSHIWWVLISQNVYWFQCRNTWSPIEDGRDKRYQTIFPPSFSLHLLTISLVQVGGQAE